MEGEHIPMESECYGNALDNLTLDQRNYSQCMDTVAISRSCEASKQMIIEVFKNTIGILEEFERREIQNKDLDIPRSYVKIPDQAAKTDKSVQVILQAQILILRIQLATCVSSIRDAVSEDLRQQTLHWLAIRQKNGLEMSFTDEFVAQMFDVLSNKEIEHPEKFNQLPGDVPNVSMDDMKQVVLQQYRVGFIDDKYVCGMEIEKFPDISKEDVDLGIGRLNKYRELEPLQLTCETPRWGHVTSDSVI